MKQNFIKNIGVGEPLELASILEYRPGQVISLTMAQNSSSSMTLFAFAQGEEISTHSAPGDAMVYVLDGKTEITIGDRVHVLEKGQTIVMPANVPHGLKALESFKMLLIVIMQ